MVKKTVNPGSEKAYRYQKGLLRVVTGNSHYETKGENKTKKNPNQNPTTNNKNPNKHKQNPPTKKKQPHNIRSKINGFRLLSFISPTPPALENCFFPIRNGNCYTFHEIKVTTMLQMNGYFKQGGIVNSLCGKKPN